MVSPASRPAPHKYIVVKKFKTLNSQPARNALKPEEFSWIENLMPIGNGFIPMVPGPNTALATINTDSAGTSTVTHSLLFHFDSSLLDTTGTESWGISTLDTTVSKFGAGSMKVTTAGSNQQPGYHFGQFYGGDWTFQAFCQTNNFQILQITLEGNRVELAYNTAASQMAWVLNSILSRTVSVSITPDVFNHVAIVRESTASLYSLYFAGARLDVFTSTANITDVSVGAVCISSQATDSWVDEFAFSGAAEYTGTTYAVPTAAFSI